MLSYLEKHAKEDRYFYYALKVDNMASHDVDLKWKEKNVDKIMTVKSLETKSYHAVMRSKETPNPITVRAYEAGTVRSVLLNHENDIKVQPSTGNKQTYLRVEPNGEILEYDFCNIVCKWLPNLCLLFRRIVEVKNIFPGFRCKELAK